MPRIFLPLEETSGPITMTDDKARYLSSVLRCRIGDMLLVVNGKGLEYTTRITAVSKREVTAHIVSSRCHDTESPLRLTLLQGILKGEKMDFVIQKTAELGITEVVPLITERSQLRDTRKVSRWKKIAEEAARQSGRTSVPVIHDLISLDDFAAGIPPAVGQEGNPAGILFWEEEGDRLHTAIEKFRKPATALMFGIGPEGGFTHREAALAQSRGFITASLGERILRAETAAIAATALLQFSLGDLSE